MTVAALMAAQAAEAALDEIDRVEDQLTVYREESEVSRLNRLAASEPVQVADDLFQLLSQSAKLTGSGLGGGQGFRPPASFSAEIHITRRQTAAALPAPSRDSADAKTVLNAARPDNCGALSRPDLWGFVRFAIHCSALTCFEVM